MGTSLVRFTTADAPTQRWGVLVQSQVFPLSISSIDSDHHRDVMEIYYSDRARFDASISATGIDATSVEFQAPLSREIQLLAQGLNYASHRAEGGYKGETEEEAAAEENLLFMKASSSISKPNETILRPSGCRLLDYEIELGIVLKRDIHSSVQVTDENLCDYVGGFILCNDVSARDLMFGAPAMQWYRGKSHRTFCPSGPVLFLPDPEDFSQLYRLELKLHLNGKLMQDAVTSQLIHKPPKTLTELSEFNDMNAGDCILTGTPGGVLVELTPKAALAIVFNMRNNKKRRAKFTKAQLSQSDFLKPGDVLDLEIKSSDGSIDLGKQHNEIAEA